MASQRDGPVVRQRRVQVAWQLLYEELVYDNSLGIAVNWFRPEGSWRCFVFLVSKPSDRQTNQKQFERSQTELYGERQDIATPNIVYGNCQQQLGVNMSKVKFLCFFCVSGCICELHIISCMYVDNSNDTHYVCMMVYIVYICICILYIYDNHRCTIDWYNTYFRNIYT